jgi:hypothetical protein
VHQATLDEVVERFGHGNDQREAQGESLRWLIPLCVNAAITKILINGSFVTNAGEPNDVDCVLLAGQDYNESSDAAQLLLNGLPFLEIKVVSQDDYDWFASVVFGADRVMIAKGVIEVAV